MTNLLTGKVAVITGASSGNGRGIALAFANHGAKAIIVADVRAEPREGGKPTHEIIEAETQTRAKFVSCDVTRVSDLEAAVTAAEEFGGIDIMVNNAGITMPGDFLSTTEETFDRMMAVNVKGVYFGAQAAARSMVKKGSGCIINMSSTAGIQGSAGGSSYSTTKGAVRLLTYSLAQELGPKGIRVNAIHPGLIVTTMTTQDVPIVGSESGERILKNIPLHRFGLPADIGNTAIYLASDLASYVNGTSLTVDGGLLRV
jgi:NAD(P)-dependent dehydrogenase (short-subunit alcohol dehydrogenase family)